MRIDFDKCIKDGVEQAMKECELTIGMTLKETVEKQIPKKPINREGTTYFYCPVCDGNRLNNYCADCGQAIDWSDTE